MKATPGGVVQNFCTEAQKEGNPAYILHSEQAHLEVAKIYSADIAARLPMPPFSAPEAPPDSPQHRGPSRYDRGLRTNQPVHNSQ